MNQTKNGLSFPFRKKGQMMAGMMIGLIMFLIVIFVFTMSTYFGKYILTEMEPSVNDGSLSNESVAIYEEVNDRYPSVFTGLFVMVFVGLIMIALVSSFVADEHPILFVLMMFVMIFLIIASAILGNFYEEFFSDAEYTGLTAQFLIPHFLMTHMMEISIVIVMLMGIIAFIKREG